MPAGHFVEYSFPVSDEDIYQVNPHRLSSRPRQRTVSVSSSIYSKIIPEMPRVKPASPVVSQPGLNSAYGSFTIPGHASHSLKSMMSHLPHSHHNRLERHSLTRKASQDSQYSSDNNMPSTPHSPLSIHSAFDVRLPMNRTPSSSSMEDPYAPSSTHYFHRRQSSAESSQMHPILESMERRSRLSGRNVCATCKKPGYNYPRCGKCGETWCSRDCRLCGGAKRHVCSSRDI